MKTLARPQDVVPFIQNFVHEQTQDPQAPVSLELALEDRSEPVIYDPYNERVKLYGVSALELQETAAPERPQEVASKITAYAPAGEKAQWRELGFRHEGVIRGFFEDGDAHLWAAYTDPERRVSEKEALHEAGVKIALAKPVLPTPELPAGYQCEVGRPQDSRLIAELMDTTFADYPTPIHEDLIEEQIRTHANHFRVVRDQHGEVAAVASAEMDHERKSAEMTDCATRLRDRGKGLMAYILNRLEADISRRFGIHDLYTLARADEIGMNCVFSKLGYDYSGRLVNNCRMPNGWESMNVWCKQAPALN